MLMKISTIYAIGFRVSYSSSAPAVATIAKIVRIKLTTLMMKQLAFGRRDMRLNQVGYYRLPV